MSSSFPILYNESLPFLHHHIQQTFLSHFGEEVFFSLTEIIFYKKHKQTGPSETNEDKGAMSRGLGTSSSSDVRFGAEFLNIVYSLCLLVIVAWLQFCPKLVEKWHRTLPKLASFNL